MGLTQPLFKVINYFKECIKMQKLIDLTKGQPRVFIILSTPHAKAEFLKQATDEGFMLGKKLPTQCKCENVMIIHDNYTINYCVGMATNMLYHQPNSLRVDYEKYIEGASDYFVGVDEL
jgi:hypothetical protein